MGATLAFANMHHVEQLCFGVTASLVCSVLDEGPDLVACPLAWLPIGAPTQPPSTHHSLPLSLQPCDQ